MHPVIWKEHDNSWTWSIEEGKAFEKGHEVLARDEGFATRGDAKEAMQEVWLGLIEAGRKPGRPGSIATSLPSDQDDSRRNSSNKKKARVVNDAKDSLEWAVVTNDKIVAVFATQSQAKKFGSANYKRKYTVQRVVCAIAGRPGKT